MRRFQPHSAASAEPSRTVDPKNFTTQIDNPYLILRPGTTFVYQDAEGVVDTVVVTRDTVTILGVTCVVVHDTATLNGQVIEDTFDWYAQDKQGNVWYFGEDTKEFEPGNPVPISTTGSWKAGVDGADPGIVMEAHPQKGDVYLQENAPGVAEDTAKVLSLDSSADVPYGSFDDVLRTKEYSPLSPSVENKYNVAGVGFVLATSSGGNREELVKVIVDGTGGNDSLVGYVGGDEINGLAGNDQMQGLGGNDTMSGGLGRDSLNGGAGDDSLNGGNGGDTFVFQNLSNGVIETDTVADYHRAQNDVIDLPQGTGSIVSDSFVDGNWQLTLQGDGDVIQLPGVSDVNNNGHIIDDLLIT
jgi:Ca2+-binding RTX toxin-like protein